MFAKTDPCDVMTNSVMDCRKSVEVGGRKRNFFAFVTWKVLLIFSKLVCFTSGGIHMHFCSIYHPQIQISLATPIFGTLLSIYDICSFYFSRLQLNVF